MSRSNIHRLPPVQAVADAYYKDYWTNSPNSSRRPWGYTVETATHGIRMIL